MIHVIELRDATEAAVWFAFDEDDFARKVAAGDVLHAHEIHDAITPRELLALLDRNPDTAGVEDEFPQIAALGRQHGWDDLLYRADYLKGRGCYDAEPVDERAACAAALQARGNCRIYWTDAAAVAAVEGQDAILAERQHWRARVALREQLLALDVIAD